MTARILVVDDNEVNLELLVHWLEQEGYVVSTAANGFEALAQIEVEKPDIILLDIMMPELDGFETCRRIKADPATAHIPVVMVTALDDVDDLVRGFEAGADDFLTKPLNRRELIARVHVQLQRKQEFERVLERAVVDALTGAFNRDYFDTHAPRLAARCRAAGHPVAVLMIDVDNLKQINDAHLHAAGNQALKQVVNRITSALRPSDLVARIGGDEFAVVMPETDLEPAVQIAERLRGRIGDTPVEGVTVTVSVGVAASALDEDLDATFERADAALYESKRAGGNRVSGEIGETRSIRGMRSGGGDGCA